MGENCQNCAQVVIGNFCSNCGQNSTFERIDKNYAKNEFLNLIGYEKGFLYTFKELLLRPTTNISTYLKTNRNKLTKPLTFLILSSVIYTLVVNYLQIAIENEEKFKEIYGNSSIITIFNWIQGNYGYANILMLVFVAFWTNIFFRKYKFNFYEVIVILCFVIGESMLLLSIEPIISKYLKIPILSSAIYWLVFAYISFAIGSVFERKFSSYLKAFSAYIIGMLTFGILASIIAIIYDIIIK